MMADVLGTMPLAPDAAAPRASGTLRAHYAPRTPLTLASPDQLPHYLAALPADGRLAWVGGAQVSADPRCVFVPAPATPDAYAQALYGLLRKLDKEGFQPARVRASPRRPRLGRGARPPGARGGGVRAHSQRLLLLDPFPQAGEGSKPRAFDLPEGASMRHHANQGAPRNTHSINASCASCAAEAFGWLM